MPVHRACRCRRVGRRPLRREKGRPELRRIPGSKRRTTMRTGFSRSLGQALGRSETFRPYYRLAPRAPGAEREEAEPFSRGMFALPHSGTACGRTAFDKLAAFDLRFPRSSAVFVTAGSGIAFGWRLNTPARHSAIAETGRLPDYRFRPSWGNRVARENAGTRACRAWAPSCRQARAQNRRRDCGSETA